MFTPILALFLASVPATASPTQVPDVLVPPESAQFQALQAHYSAALAELTAADVSHLSPAQRAERTRLLDVLRDFSECGEFGHNDEFAGARMPYFRDYDGRRCAVAHLLFASGEGSFVEDVRFVANHAWISDLQGVPEFESWLARVGLSIEDAARIQVPTIGIGRGTPVTGGPPTDPGPPMGPTRPAGGTNTGPGDTVPAGTGGTARGGPTGPASGGNTPASPGSGGPRGPANTPTAGGPGAGPSTGMPSPVTLTTTSDDSWWLWWEYNKLEYLRPNRLSLRNMPTTGDDVDAAFRSAIENARRTMLPLFEKSLADADATVRATATIALGRVGRGVGIDKLVAMLADPNVDVRHQAILALGATGSPEAVLPLLSIAKYGALAEGAKERISSVARPLAIVALGFGRKLGFDARLDVEIAKLVQTRTKTEREAIGVAALVYQMLAPCKELERYALAMAKDDSESPSVRCRAIESLRTATDNATLSDLQHFLSGPRLDLRRSAALALGDFDHPLALPGLIVAFELEAEPLTRGFILTSIGKHAGVKARDYLTSVLAKGESGMRCWSALGLGIHARQSNDADVSREIARTIRDAVPREKNRDALGAYWLASGLARDDGARTSMRNALNGAGDARQRMYAASALALLGGDASVEVLAQRIQEESQPVVRVAIGQALGVLGRARDVPSMLEMIVRLNEPALQGLAATAMAFHGSPDALRALQELALSDAGSTVRRAAAIEGLGMMLGSTSPLAFADISREANYTVFSDWVSGIFQTTL